MATIGRPTHILAEVREILGVKYKSTERLCTFSGINKWAKYKPVRCLGFVGQAGKTSGSDYWKGEHGECGLNIDAKIKGSFTPSDLNWSWDYLRPQGGLSPSGTPFRLLDFDGYNTYAPNESQIPTGRLPIAGTPSITFETGEAPHFDVFVNLISSLPEMVDILTRNDISIRVGNRDYPLKDWCVGLFVDTGLNEYYFSNGGDKTLEYLGRPELGGDTFYYREAMHIDDFNRTWTLYPYLYHSLPDDEVAIASFGVSPWSLMVYRPSNTVRGTLHSVSLSGTRLDYSALVENGYMSQKEIRLEIRVYSSESRWELDRDKPGFYETYYRDVTLSAVSHQEIVGDIDVSGSGLRGSWVAVDVRIILDGSSITMEGGEENIVREGQ